ncbi:MAG: hypothetical protein WKF33_01180 [Thermoleophilaceae bacterium]
MTASEPPPEEEGRQVPVVWVGVEDLPVHLVNQLLAVVQPNEIFLSFGTIVPPAIMGETLEERRAQAEAIPFVQVKPIARFGLTPERLTEFIGILQQTLTNYEAQQRSLPS